MKTIINILLLWLMSWGVVQAQTESVLKTKYMITHDKAKEIFTAWVVPKYDTPNFNNPDAEEKGVTAQFSLKVPRGFTLNSLIDLKGNWEKTPVKIGTQKVFSKANLDTQYEYYIIGKGNTETNYGEFKNGEPIALFTFKATIDDATKVTILENDDPFVEIADKSFALNVRSSFYSRSGQSTAASSKPLEQHEGITSLKEVLALLANKVIKETNLESDSKVLTYPNPANESVNLKIFVEKANVNVGIDIIDGLGIIQQSSKLKGSIGINTFQINLKNIKSGDYFIKVSIEEKVYTEKVIKIE